MQLLNILAQAAKGASEAAPPLPTVTVPGTEEGTYLVAQWIMKMVYWILKIFGLSHHPTLILWIYAILVLAISWGMGLIAKSVILFVVDQIGKRWKGHMYSELIRAKFFSKFSRIIPAIVFLIFIQFTLQGHSTLSMWLSRVTWIYLAFVMARCLSILVSVIWNHVDMKENTRHLPLKGLVQLVCGVIWIIFAIVSIAILLNKSPGSLFAGLGAFAAVLMLVFKDSILGVVAGVQLSENDSLHVGDWIRVDSSGANGTVVGVSLTEVKVQNWDKTVTSVPPYNLISSGFTTYLPMQQSNTRRIQRTYLIDADSVVETTPEMLDRYAQIPLLKDWIEKKRQQKAEGKEYCVNNPLGLVDGTIDTNIGVFRAYLKLWLLANSDISQNDTQFVCTLQQTSTGLPLQIYCFTNTSSWLPYEGIQCAVFEHIAVSLAKFDLYVFESGSGRDTILEGVMGRDLPAGETVVGLPTPFFVKSAQQPAPAATAAVTSPAPTK